MVLPQGPFLQDESAIEKIFKSWYSSLYTQANKHNMFETPGLIQSYGRHLLHDATMAIHATKRPPMVPIPDGTARSTETGPSVAATRHKPFVTTIHAIF